MTLLKKLFSVQQQTPPLPRDIGPHAAVVIIDLKGDMALFESTRIEAQKEGRTFKFFTNEIQKATYAYNPFQSKDNRNISLNQTCETFLEALGIDHGEGYGRSYYARVARQLLARMLRGFEAQQGRRVRSFAELHHYALLEENVRDPKERQDAFELLAVIESLAAFPQLNVTCDTVEYPEAYRNAIYIPDVLVNKEIVYFWLPSSKETATVREIAKLALFDLLLCAQNGTGNHPVYVVIDEFQRIASEHFKVILQQARSMNIAVILSNQTIQDLNTPDADLRPTVQTNTRFKQIFSATDIEQQDWVMAMSGEFIDYRTTIGTMERHSVGESTGSSSGSSSGSGETQHSSSSSSGTNRSVSWGSSLSRAEDIRPRLQRNDIIQVSDDPLQSIVHISRGSRHTQYGGFSIPVKLGFPLTLDAFIARRDADWPAHEDGVTLVADDTAPVSAAPPVVAAPTTPAALPVQVVTAQGTPPNVAQNFQQMLQAAQQRLQQTASPARRRKK